MARTTTSRSPSGHAHRSTSSAGPGSGPTTGGASVLRAARAVVDGREVGVSLVLEDGRIAAVRAYDAEIAAGLPVTRLAADEVLLPGVVDTHVHVNEPGRTEWEGFASATRAAAAGGVTTIVDMPLNCVPPTVDVASLDAKRAAARGQCYVDVGFWGGAVPGNTSDLRPLHDEGVFGFKCFLVASGVEEFPPLGTSELRGVLAETATLDAMVIVHAEDEASIEAAPPHHGPVFADFVASRPPSAERRAIHDVLTAARATGARVHVLHLSDAGSLPMLRAAMDDHVRVSVETCPHYLTFEAESVPDGATELKCCPPIRDRANREALWEGLAAGTIGTVVTDHSPCTVDLKALDSGDFGLAWGGVAALQVGLPAVWTEARRRGHSLVEVVAWMATGPADLVGLTDRGRIAVGAVADFAVLAPEESFTVDAARLHHRNPLSAYAGRTLTGAVRRTVLRGAPIDLAAPPRGELLRRGAS